MYLFSTHIDTEDLNDYFLHGYKLKLKNGTSFKFQGIMYEYFFYSEDGFSSGDYQQIITAKYISNDNDTQKANQILTKSLHILSYIFFAPLAEFNFGEPQNVMTFIEPQYSPLKKVHLLTHIDGLVNRIKVKQEDLLYTIMSLYYAHIRFLYLDGFDSDSFFAAFKIIEILASNNYKHFHQQKKYRFMSELKEKVGQQIINKSGIVFTNDQIDDICGEFNTLLNNKIKTDIHPKIMLLLNYVNVKTPPEEIHSIIKLRNKIAHGDSIEQSELDYNLPIVRKIVDQVVSYCFFKLKSNQMKIWPLNEIFI